MDYSLPSSSAHGILQTRILESVAMPSSWGSSQPKDQTHVSYLLHWQVSSLSLAPQEAPQNWLKATEYIPVQLMNLGFPWLMGKHVIPEGVRLAQMVSEGKLNTCLTLGSSGNTF